MQRSVQEEQRRAKGLQSQIDRFAARQREEHNANAARFRQVRSPDSRWQAKCTPQRLLMLMKSHTAPEKI